TLRRGVERSARSFIRPRLPPWPAGAFSLTGGACGRRIGGRRGALIGDPYARNADALRSPSPWLRPKAPSRVGSHVALHHVHDDPAGPNHLDRASGRRGFTVVMERLSRLGRSLALVWDSETRQEHLLALRGMDHPRLWGDRGGIRLWIVWSPGQSFSCPFL